MVVHAEAHPPAANQSSRVDARTLGMFLFIGSEIMLFGAFFTMYFFVRVVNPDAAVAEKNILVVANETMLSEALMSSIRSRSEFGPASFLIVAPQSDELPHPEAARRLRRALSELRSEGIDAHGQVVHPDPFTAAMEARDDERIDEIIVSTFPSERSGWLRRDLVERLRRESGVPVEHVVSEEGT